MKLGDLINLRPAIQALMKQDGIPFKKLYALSKSVIAADNAFRFYCETKDGLLVKYGSPSKDREGEYVIPEDKRETFYNALSELNGTDAEVSFDPVELPPDGIGMTGEQMIQLVNHGIVTVKEV